MDMKKILLCSALGLAAACGRSSHQGQDLTLPPPYSFDSEDYSKIHTVPLTVGARLSQSDLSFGPVTILDSLAPEGDISSHEFILPVTNTGSYILCYVRMDFKPAGETRSDLSQQFAYAEGQLMNSGPCIPAGATGYFMSYADSSEPVLKGLELLEAEAIADDHSTLVKEVEVVDQSISGSEVRVLLRNISGRNLSPASFSRWLLRTPEKFLDWGFFFTEDEGTVAPGKTFELYEPLFRGPLPPDTTFEFFPDFSVL